MTSILSFFNILNTNFTFRTILIFDQDVAQNFEKRNKISEEYLSLPKKEKDNIEAHNKNTTLILGPFNFEPEKRK